MPPADHFPPTSPSLRHTPKRDRIQERELGGATEQHEQDIRTSSATPSALAVLSPSRRPISRKEFRDVGNNPFISGTEKQSRSQAHAPTVTSDGYDQQPTHTAQHTSRRDSGAQSSNSGHSGNKSGIDKNDGLKWTDDRFDYRQATADDLKRARKDLKAWETAFKSEHQRDATQEDISKDGAMVKKYRAYRKIKTALTSQVQKRQSSAAGKEPGSSHTTRDTASAQQSIPSTPTKTKRPTHAMADVTRTPTRKQEVEFVSPRKILNSAGFMSPGKSSPRDVDRHEFLASIASLTPRSQRTKLLMLSPSRRAMLRSPTPKQSPSSLFTIQEQPTQTKPNSSSATETSESTYLTGLSELPVGLRTPTRSDNLLSLMGLRSSPLLRTPTGKRSQVSPLLSPSRSLRSPLFGGMSSRRIKRPSQPVAEDTADIRATTPVAKDLEPANITSSIGENLSQEDYLTNFQEEFSATETRFPNSSLLTTPKKSGAAKAARALFRRPSVTSLTASPSSRGRSPSASGHVYDMEAAASRIHDLFRQRPISPTPTGGPHSPTMSPIRTPPRRRSTSQQSPGSSSQELGLSFSQPSIGSVTPEPDFFVVPPGFHSHHMRRRNQARATLFVPSQEEEAEFEREFNLTESSNINAGRTTLSQGHPNFMETFEATELVATGSKENTAYVDDNDWEDQVGDANHGVDSLWANRPAPRKKYTQKRTTRLHRIAVAPSEKVERDEKEKKAPKSTSKQQSTSLDRGAATDNSGSNDNLHTKGQTETNEDRTASSKKEATTTAAETKTGSRSTPVDPSDPGWAFSNRPMVKSERRIPGVGQGRAAARRSFASGNENYVAYNLQRGPMRKGASFARGKFKFAGRQRSFGSSGSGAGGRGTYFDGGFDDGAHEGDVSNMVVMSSLDDGVANMGTVVVDDEMEGDEDDLPWYGSLDEDKDDSYVVTVSERYLRPTYGDSNDPEEFVKELEQQEESRSPSNFRVNLAHVLRKGWGYPSFRDRQFESIKRVLNAESTLLVQPTGSGKSLSYQLPAYIFSQLGIPSLTLVISPMISLMYDQVKCLPPGLVGACWTSVEQSSAQFKDFMDKLRSNTIKILFISPEKLQSPSFLSLVRTRQIPRITFLCVDEVHCLSEWSHNFRPAYLRLNHILKTDLGSPCVLGLTGTATEGTKDSICEMLEIDRTTGVFSGPVIRENLAMTVSLEIDRETALLNLLQSPRFVPMDAILIYVMKQTQADALAGFLRVRNFSAESYHAGKSSQERQRIQNRFMNDGSQKLLPTGSIGVTRERAVGGGSAREGGSGSGSGGIRILCATIAFGLGLNKSNIRSVIHFCMPKSLENYIQEIGRSGRDGDRSYCHMFLNQDDYLRLRSLSYADGLDWGSMLRLVKKIFSRKNLSKSDTLSSSKKRLLLTEWGDEDSGANGNDGNDGDELKWGSSQPSAVKKIRKNDHRAVASGTRTSSSQAVMQSLAGSNESILVVPPPPAITGINMNATKDGTLRSSRRVVEVREELAEEEFDIKKEVLATLLSYMELDASKAIKVTGSVPSRCTVKFLKEGEVLFNLAADAPLIDLILKQGMPTGHSGLGGGNKRGGYNRSGFSGSTLTMAHCCDTQYLCQQLGLTYTELLQDLQLFKRKKWAVFEMSDPAYCVEILKEPADYIASTRRTDARKGTVEEEDSDMELLEDTNSEVYEKDHDRFIFELSERLYKKMCAVERVGVAKVDEVYGLFQSVATSTWQQQEVFKPRETPTDDEAEEDRGNEDYGGESTEYDDDVDDEYIQAKGRMKSKDKHRKTEVSGSSSTVGDKGSRRRGGGRSDSFVATGPELVLQGGIEQYFARQSGEGIGGLHAVEELFPRQHDDKAGSDATSDNHHRKSGNMMELYQYENEMVNNLQRKWRSAVEVDLKVFISQQQQQQQESSSSRPIDSARVISRIFHGIGSPCFPALEWSRHKYWAKYVHFDFAQLMQMSQRILQDRRSNKRVGASTS